MRTITLSMMAVLMLSGLSCSGARYERIGMPEEQLPTVTGAKLPVPMPKISPREFPVKEYGAVGDGIADDTDAIRRAIEDANSHGGGTVIFSGGVFLSGPLDMVSGLSLQLDGDAILRMLPMERYAAVAAKGGGRYQALIGAGGLHDVALTGSGIIEGQGQPWWDAFKAKTLAAKRPIQALFYGSSRVLVQGVRFQDAPNIHLVISGSNDVTIDGVRVETTPASPNTDAFNIRGKNILIQNCIISCGDDNIALSGPSEGITIRDCKFLRGHGLSIGSYTRNGLSNMLVENCTFDKTESALQGKCDRGKGGVVGNLLYRNIRITGVKHPIWFHSEYDHKMKDPNQETFVPSDNLTPVWKNVTFENVTAIVPGKYPAGTLWGLPEAAIENFTFRNVNITASRGFEVFYARGITFEGDCRITPAVGEPIITYRATVRQEFK